MATTEQKLTDLLAWASKHGAELHPSVEVYQDSDTGLSFRVKAESTSPVPEYDTIISLPTSLMLSYVNAITDKSPSALHSKILTTLKPHVIGRAFLVKEFLLGQESFWWPYIQMLPQPNDTDLWLLPPFWLRDAAALLEGTNVDVGRQKISDTVEAEYAEMQEILKQSGDEFLNQLTRELYEWAYCIFSSRSFRPSLVLSEEQKSSLPSGVKIDDFSVLLPVFDVGNHDMTRQIKWEMNKKGDACKLKIGKEHVPGEQIFNNYSLKSNAELLLGYGFMIPSSDGLHNDYIHVRKRSNDPTSSEEYFISRRPISHSSSILVRSKLTAQMLERAPRTMMAFQNVQPDMVWDIFCAVTTPEQREQLIPIEGVKFKDPKDQENYRQDKFLSGEVNEACMMFLGQTAATVQHKLIQELEKLNETEVEVDEEDYDLLTKHQKFALEYRARCRRVLEGALEAMERDKILF